jgi:choice-of-anchor B domain-containing protein
MKNFLLLLLAMHCFGVYGQSNNMSLLSQWDDNSLPATSDGQQYNDCWGYTANNREYAIMGSLRHNMFFDVTDPANPVLIDSLSAPVGGGSSIWRDFKVYKTYCYAVADQTTQGLLIYSLRNLPNSVALDTQIVSGFTRAHNIYIDGPAKRLYVAGANTCGSGVIVYDLTIPDKPVNLGCVNTGGYVHDVHVRDNIAYLSSGNPGLRVYDLTNPAAPLFKASYASPIPYGSGMYNHSSWLNDAGNTLFIAYETRGIKLESVDVTDYAINDINFLDTFYSQNLGPMSPGSIVHNPFARGNYLYCAYYHEGIVAFDISNPSNIGNPQAFYDTEPNNTNYNGWKGPWGVYPYLPSGTVIGSDQLHGLFLLKHCPPNVCYKPTSVSTTAIGSTSATANWTAITCATLYQIKLTQVGVGNTTINVANPSAISTILGSLLPGTAYSWKIRAKCGATWSPWSAAKSFTTASNLQESGSEGLSPENANYNEQLYIYPNPVQGSFQLELDGVDGESAELLIMDNLGKIWRSEKVAVEDGYLTSDMDITELTAGIYFVSVRTNDRVWTQKVLKN